MGVEYVPGPHKQVLEPSQKAAITKALQTCASQGSFYGALNTQYNNVTHFGMPMFDTDPQMFLADIQSAASSKWHTLQVMGSEHSDPYGHSSHMFGQINGYGYFEPALARDTYIRFKLVQDPKNYKIFRSMNESKIYHFLVKSPIILKIGDVRHPVIVADTADSRILPIAHPSYKNKMTFQFVSSL